MTSQRLQTRSGLSEPTVQRLRFVDMIAGRHDGHVEPQTLPSLAFVDAQRRSLRIQLVAHLVAQHQDVANRVHRELVHLNWPSEPELRERVEALLPAELREADSGQLFLAGAWGRLIALWGEGAEALRLQLGAVDGLSELGDDAELGRPLSEALRLAGLLGDRTTFKKMLTTWDELSRRRPQEATSSWLQLAAGRGWLALGELESGEELLRRLVAAGGTDRYVRASAARLLVSVAAPGEKDALREVLSAAPAAAMWQLLARIDGAEPGPALGLVSELETIPIARALIGHLRRGFGDAAGVARWFPY